MSQKTNKNGLLGRKFISSFLLVSFLFSQVLVPIHQAKAMDVNQLVANIVDITTKISVQIEKVGGGVLKAGIATALNSFAQNLAMNTVTGMATGNWGAQPLFFQFPLEDMLQQMVDQVTGDYLDKLSEKLTYDVCKPLDADLDWRFKLALNIIPEQRDNTLDMTPPKCTLSKFVDAINQSFENMSSAIRKTFAADCFDEFQPVSIVGAVTPESDAATSAVGGVVDVSADLIYNTTGALSNFTYEGIKDYYLYNVPSLNEKEARASYFTKKAVYYKQKNINAACTSYKATTTVCLSYEQIDATDANGQFILNDDGSRKKTNGNCIDPKTEPGSNFCKLSEYKNANKTSDCATDLDINLNLTVDVGNSEMSEVVGGTCLSYELPDKIADVYQADKTKQRKFLTQYKTCYLVKMSTAFKGLLEVGQLPKQKIQEQKTKIGCTDLVDSLITPGYSKNAAEFYSAYDLYFKKSFWDKNKIIGKDNPELYKTVLRSALLAKIGDNNSTASGTMFLGYIKSKINFFDPFEQALVNCTSVSDGSIDVSRCVNEEGEDGKVSSNVSSALDTSVIGLFESDFKGLMIKSGEQDSSGTLFVDNIDAPTMIYYTDDSNTSYSVGLTQSNGKDYLSNTNNSKISEIRTDLINVCLKNAINQVSSLSWAQSEKTKAYIDQEKEKQLLEIKKNQEIVKANVAKSDVKAVSEPISHEIKSTPGMVTFNLEQALGSSANMLQPTGDLFIDPIKIFLTTLLSEGSKKLMEGLFTRAFSTDGVDADLSALDDINQAEDATTAIEEEDASCTVPGPLAIGSICVVDGKYNDGICKTCYCESRIGSLDSKGTTTYGTCQTMPVSR